MDIPLISPPYSQDPLQEPFEEAKIHQLIPYIPETPEILIDFPFSTVSLPKVLETNRNIAIMGEIGSGKSSLLAAFASQVIEKKVNTVSFHEYLPLLLHVSDIDLESIEELDSIQSILSSSIFSTLGIDFNVIKGKISDYARTNHLIIMLDGMDELNQTQFQRAVQWVNKFQNSYPNNYYVVAAGPSYSDGLEKLGFSPYFISPINSEIQEKLISNWESSYRRLPVVQSTGKRSNADLLIRWLNQETLSKNILTLTLEVWNHLFSDKTSGNLKVLINGYLERISNNKLPIEFMVNIATEMEFSSNKSISKTKLESMLHEIASLDRGRRDSDKSNDSIDINSNPSEESFSVSELVKNGLLIERTKDSYQFAFPFIFACLLSFSIPNDFNTDWQTLLRSPMKELRIRFSDKTDYLLNWINLDDEPLFRNLFCFSNHLEKLPDSSSVKKKLYQEILNLLQDDSLPFPLRIRLLSAFSSSEENSIQQLLNYLSKHPGSNIRQIAAFGYGIYQSDKSVVRLEELLKDNSRDVRCFSCLSLGKIWNKKAQKILVDNFLNNNDELRQIIAEIFSHHSKEGHEILKELTTIDDIGSRKSAILGLSLIKESWVKELLEKISTTDSQWIVRDTAVHALENLEVSRINNNMSNTSPFESPWLLRFASNMGLGIPADKFPFELLFRVLETGTLNEQKAAIDFLTQQPSVDAKNKLINLTRAENPVRDYALDALFRISRKGIDKELSF
ncbi:MAG: hypothetical protein C0417_00170 [Chlorobiaceae bacterium]|nr:hypothetical protein [Chlorobiaceae bacterium]